MTAWILVGLTCLVGLVVTLVALLADSRTYAFLPLEPAWLVPAPKEARNTRFPRAWRGYHPPSVDVFLNALTAAYEELYDLAGPDLVAQARQRLAGRLTDHSGNDPGELPKEVR